MPKISLAGFKDPVRRPRYIIWTGVAVLMLAAVMIVALGVTSTRWFCAEVCHKVQDDTILAYEASTHANVGCMACHMPPNANPVVFILHKAEALGELYLTVTDQFELPLNKESHVALTMTSPQCTQCHNMENRTFTPSKGIKIDHAVHAEVNAACTVCHNRVAHKENFELTLNDPNTGEPNRKHADFMSMTACFRCHSLEKGAAAPGTCSACHTPDFNLKPDSHLEEDFFPAEHGDLAKEFQAEAEKAAQEGAGEEGEAAEEGGEEGTQSPEGEGAEGDEKKESSLVGPEKAYASGGGEEKERVSKEEVGELLAAQRSHGSDPDASVGAELPKVEEIFYCSTCHATKFCSDCHGMEMPHPAEFKEPKDAKDPKGHPVISKNKAAAAKCVMCHGQNNKTFFCDSCHHGTAVKWEFKKNQPWTQRQHPAAVKASGIDSCTAKCHQAKFCSTCHTRLKVVPSSHEQKNWTRPKTFTVTNYGKEAAKPTATHALDAQKSLDSCEICHGAGGPTSKFCMGCHKLQLPHPADFKQNHVSSKKNPAACRNCHAFKELCSNCHHVGSSFTKTWISVHGASTNKNGTAGCVEKCHEKADCVKCHTSRKVVPASHKNGKFVRDFSSKKAGHVQLYTSNGELCSYCHAGDVAQLAKTKFCNNCHKLEMPHPSGFGAKGAGNGGQHQELLNTKKTTRQVCANCHQTAMCNSCHHEGAPTNKPWMRAHPASVKKSGAEPCFKCHKPTFCANCHVNLAKKGLLN